MKNCRSATRFTATTTATHTREGVFRPAGVDEEKTSTPSYRVRFPTPATGATTAFYYDAAHAESEHVNFIGYTVKGGANYNINEKHNVFANLGYISRAPFFSGGAFPAEHHE